MAPLALLALAGAAAAARLPDGPLIVGYQSWGTCNETKTVAAARAGVNVIIWFATNLADVNGTATVSGGPDYACVAAVAAALVAEDLPTTHLISIGGWDAPHPSTRWTGPEWFEVWDAWNAALPRPFDGFDWDLEGNDDLNASTNAFTQACLDLVVDMSEAAAGAGYLVSMVPAQSYFDVTTPAFDRSLRHVYPDFHPDFPYHGMNCYAYMYARAKRGTFAFVTVQLYESWSRADAALCAGEGPVAYLRSWARDVLRGWAIDKEGEQFISVTNLVVGLSRGSSDGKSAFFWPEACGEAYLAAPAAERPRGYAFWNIPSEGGTVNGTNATLAFAPALNAFLHVRG